MSTQAHSDVDLSTPRKIHVIGAGGAGMSAIASVLVEMGHQVTGSDLKSSPALERLGAAGSTVWVGHDASHLGEAEIVAVSSAVRESNPEVLEARRRGLQVVTRAGLLGAVARQRRVVAISGTHGKTTTTSMTSLIMVEAGLDPSFLIGGDVNEIGTNAVWDVGEWVVIEADESDGTFCEIPREVAVVTNVEPDHLDHFGSIAALHEGFERFCAEARCVVASGDDPVAAEIALAHNGLLVGFKNTCSHRILNFAQGPQGISFDLSAWGEVVAHLSTPVPGKHNARNAAVAAVAAHEAGAPFDAAARALERFTGVARRFEFRGQSRGVWFVDDYAHLPSEVQATLEAASIGPWQRVVAVFQPHRYTRTATLAEAFGPAFAGADVVFVTEVFGAGEAPLPGVSGRLIADAVTSALPGLDVHFVPRRSDVAGEVAAVLGPGDLCLTMGAGDLTTLADEIQAGEQW